MRQWCKREEWSHVGCMGASEPRFAAGAGANGGAGAWLEPLWAALTLTQRRQGWRMSGCSQSTSTQREPGWASQGCHLLGRDPHNESAPSTQAQDGIPGQWGAGATPRGSPTTPNHTITALSPWMGCGQPGMLETWPQAHCGSLGTGWPWLCSHVWVQVLHRHPGCHHGCVHALKPGSTSGCCAPAAPRLWPRSSSELCHDELVMVAGHGGHQAVHRNGHIMTPAPQEHPSAGNRGKEMSPQQPPWSHLCSVAGFDPK